MVVAFTGLPTQHIISWLLHTHSTHEAVTASERFCRIVQSASAKPQSGTWLWHSQRPNACKKDRTSFKRHDALLQSTTMQTTASIDFQRKDSSKLLDSKMARQVDKY